MKHLILLHGALGAASQFNLIKEKLKDSFHIHTIDFAGHGGKAVPEDGFSIKTFASQLSDYIAEHQLSRPLIFGYSMGGYVALYLERHAPGSIEQLITLGTKLYWDKETAIREAAMLEAEKIEAKVPAFADQLKERHQPADWKQVLKTTADMMISMGEDPPLKDEDFNKIKMPVHLMIGDKDKMVTREETELVNNLLPNSKLSILENTPHPLEMADPDKIFNILL